MELAKRYDPKVSEPKWQKFWDEENIFKFDQESDAEVYSVDTPPPTVSGKMHLGHSFSYSQQDFVVRFQRMLGKNVFYPFGTDNNGVATERLIEQINGVVAREMKREDFVKLCLETLEKDLIPSYIADMKSLGLSCDFNTFYTTIDSHTQRISQRSFIQIYKDGRAYRKDAPAMWCPECQTGISQVECQDHELESSFNDIIFKVDGEDLVIATTRPELLPACVAVFFHPGDKRYEKYEGKNAKVPLFDFEVPIMPDERADPDKGTGIVMCCTFGDQTDMEWQRARDLPIKEAIGKDGRLTELAGKYKGMSVADARKMIIEDLKDAKLLLSQEPIKHVVNVHERCGTEVEIIKSKQWFIKYLDLKDDMLKWGEELHWYPKHMKVRYDNWVKGLQWDWLISRQRFFGVPFPVWYCGDCDEVIVADEKELPVDPLAGNPPQECPKCKSKNIVPEKDVLDTWATSSLTPIIAVELLPEQFHKKLYPMTMRPQAHDIITFWLFNTLVKSRLHDKVNPWRDVVISGHAQDPEGKKMSKSKGNVIEPQDMIERYSADALRFWAAGSKLGEDLPFQEKDLVTGEKTITKMWNACKFTFMHMEDFNPEEEVELEAYDRSLISRLNRMVQGATESFMKYEYSKTKFESELFFWRNICDYYLEIAKDRLYNPDRRGQHQRKSAQHTLYVLMLNTLKLMAPIMPHITEELYQLFFKQYENTKSIHITKWPEYDEGSVSEEMERLGELVELCVEKARRAKSDNGKSLKEPVAEILLKANISEDSFSLIKDDIMGATNAQSIRFENIDSEPVCGIRL